jgi:hypothetical protein
MTEEERDNLILILRRRVEALELELAQHKATIVRLTSANPMNSSKPHQPHEGEAPHAPTT